MASACDPKKNVMSFPTTPGYLASSPVSTFRNVNMENSPGESSLLIRRTMGFPSRPEASVPESENWPPLVVAPGYSGETAERLVVKLCLISAIWL